MQKKDQIAELFKETLENYEAPVRSGMWEQVASRIETVPTPSTPGSSVTSQAVTGASKIGGSLMSWVGGAVLVASIGTGIYFYQDRNVESTSVNPANTPAAAVADQTVVASPDEISTATLPDLNKKNSEQVANEISNPNNNNKTSVNNNTAVNSGITSASPAGDISSTTSHTSAISASSSGSNPIEKNTVAETTPSRNEEGSLPAGNESFIENTAAPKAAIDAQPSSGKAPLQVSFSAPASAASTEWFFGDGTETLKGNNVSHLFTQPGSYLVTLKTTDEKGVSHVAIKKIEVLSDLTISNIPNVFTPNGDGLNDEFAVKAAEGVDIEVSIFDTGGKLVHKFNGSENSWNGKINNIREAESGTYFYIIFATGPNGEKNTQKGTLSLKR